MAIELNSISITKDSQAIKAFDFNQTIVAPSPIFQLIQVNFPELNSNQVGKFKLSDKINFDLLVKSFDIDLKHDDAESITDSQYHSGNTPIIFFLVDPTTNRLIRKITAQISGYPVEPFYFVYHRNLDIHVKSSAGFHKLSFYCEPIYISNVIEATTIT